MAALSIREYADIGVTYAGRTVQAGKEPGLVDQAITTSGTSAQSSAFNANTNVISVHTPAAQAVACVFGDNPTALTTSPRLPANSVFFFSVKPGQKIAVIDVA